MTAYDPRRGRYLAGAAWGLETPPAPVVGAGELELLVRFEHPAKFLAVKELPGAALLPDACQAAAYGIAAPELARIRERLARELRDAAAELAADPDVRAAIASFPVPAGGTLVALGDSITDDLQSWAEVLRCCLPGIAVVNAGVSGDTTADALARLYGVTELRPQLVVAMLGTNDCQRHGPDAATLVSPSRALENIASIGAWLERIGARTVWLTPPPVDDAALTRTLGDRPMQVRSDDVRALRDALCASRLRVIDVACELSADAAAGHLLPDGLHPSLAGQVRIARRVLLGLAEPAIAPGLDE